MTTQKIDVRFEALWRFALAITTLNVLGHTVFGFEQSWAQPLLSLATAYVLELLLEVIDARVTQRPLRFVGGWRPFLSFMLPAHITGLAVAMLLYTNDRLLPIMFATAAAIGSKAIFRVATPRGSQHFLNPSNFGITATLLLFPWVSIAPPYHFTENLVGLGDWILPGLIVASGTFLNVRLTKKMPLILSWLGGFIAQAVIRSLFFGTPLVAALLPMTGLAFVLYTFYMITDPATSPYAPRDQVLFGLAVAAAYGLLLTMHVVFGLFLGLTAICILRGLGMVARALSVRTLQPQPPASIPALTRRVES